MKYTEIIKIFSDAPHSEFAAELFRIELKSRLPGFSFEKAEKEKADFAFITDLSLDEDCFRISDKNGVCVYSRGIRGFIYAVGRILRKIYACEGGFELLPVVFGQFSPLKKIRGHQLGCRTTANSYESWSFEQYRRYYLDLMYFGMNTVEHIPGEKGVSKRNPLMKYDEEEFLIKACEMAEELGLDVSLWHPLNPEEPAEITAVKRKELYSRLKGLKYIFIPGGDPGELPAEEFISRCKVISRSAKSAVPGVQMWPSAQAPHSIPGWGEEFIDCMNALPEEIDGVIYGPNHALPLEELRRRLPAKYPLRFYPDITHNVRCEYPVHFERDDWHFAFAAALSRECTNPRPREYSRLYDLTSRFFIGAVSYSDGINDDVNKAVLSYRDYGGDDVKEAVEDYCRLFFFGADAERIAGLIFGLEENWEGDPALNPGIDEVYDGFNEVYGKYPFLCNNWRFLQLIMRAHCDKLVRMRRTFELRLIEKSEAKLKAGNRDNAVNTLNCAYPPEYPEIRSRISGFAQKLFELIGLQTDVEHYFADGWERGAVLETIDLPVTDRAYLLSKSQREDFADYFEINKPGKGEYYFSVSLDGVKEKQRGEPYLNFRGDNPQKNNGSLRTALFNVFDNYTYETEIEGLDDGCDYTLRVTWWNKTDPTINELRITAGDETIYCGPQFGEIDTLYSEKYCTQDYIAANYRVLAKCIKNGKLKLSFSEPLMGVMFSEYSLRKNK